MRSRTAMTMAVVAGALLAATPLLAQDPQQPRMQMQDMMHAMMGMQPAPQMILRLRQSLALTDQQVQRLEAIQQELHQAHHPHMQAAMNAMHEAQRFLEAEPPDWASYEAQLREAVNHHVQAHIAMARSMADARNVLTAEQRARLETGLEMMREMMMGGAMGGMMERMGPGTRHHQ